MRKEKKGWFDIYILSFFPILAITFSLSFKLNFLASTIFFFCVPAVYLSIRTKKAIIRSLLFSTPFSLIAGLVIDHIAAFDRSWYVPTIFPFRIFNTVPLEDLFWAFSLIYLIIIFYEHFLDKGNHKALGRRMKFFLYSSLSLLVLFILLVINNSNVLHVDYWYLKLGLFLLLIPAITFLVSFPRYVGKFLKTSPYFFFMGLSQEITALHQGYWAFPGKHFIAWVNIIGYRFPFEEFFFWLVIFSACVLCYFEFFDDNHLLWRYSEESKLLRFFSKKKKRK